MTVGTTNAQQQSSGGGGGSTEAYEMVTDSILNYVSYNSSTGMLTVNEDLMLIIQKS